MSARSNTLLTVASLSMVLGRRFISAYSQPKSPHKFTQSQLIACLILRAYLKTIYRGVIEIIVTSGQQQ